ncbi:hypothetical protein C5E12_03855 [Rathayibacter rathayi]|uniref:DUF4870 domain-containing protein n=1 Tax=Rathayibacter rathayi TaxID=33887 RepID=UPI000CE723B2|nr:DUF4870 domain-containing protein [Rathayibacter rathayi]PPI74006.1 hypothetical protein C5E12_03855 [Rathayibacter rathayi]
MDDDELRHRTRDRNGARAVWFAGLSALAGFVVISPLISLMATVMVWGSRRRIGTLSDRNGLVAVNWQLTYLALQLMLVPLHLALISVRESLTADWPLVTITAILALAVQPRAMPRARASLRLRPPGAPVVRRPLRPLLPTAALIRRCHPPGRPAPPAYRADMPLPTRPCSPPLLPAATCRVRSSASACRPHRWPTRNLQRAGW